MSENPSKRGPSGRVLTLDGLPDESQAEKARGLKPAIQVVESVARELRVRELEALHYGRRENALNFRMLSERLNTAASDLRQLRAVGE